MGNNGFFLVVRIDNFVVLYALLYGIVLFTAQCSDDRVLRGSCDFYPRATSPRLGAGAEGVGNGRETDPCRQP